MKYNFHSEGIDVNGRTSGKMKTFCPNCHDTRKNKRDKSLSVNIDLGVAKCHHCGKVYNLNRPSHSAAGPVGAPWANALPPERAPFHLPAHFQRPVFSPSHTLQLDEPVVRWFVEKRCIPQSVLQQMRIGQSYEFMTQTGQTTRCINFHYYEGDQLINTKFRDSEEKRFKMVKDAELIPYNIDGILHTPEVIITEGEIDALSFMAIGRTDVVSAPAGASNNASWLDRFVPTHFEDKHCVYIAVDDDERGHVLRDELLRRMGPERCRVVKFGPGCKDANEHLVKYGVESLRIALAQAEEVPIEGIYTVKDLEEELRLLFENGLESGAETGWEMMDRLCTYELGRLLVLTGVPGHGKSEFADELVLRLCLRNDWPVAYFSPENMPIEYHYQKLAAKLLGCTFKKDIPGMTENKYQAVVQFLDQNISHIHSYTDNTLDSILMRFRALVARRGARILVVDPYSCIDHDRPQGTTETQYIGQVLNRLSAFAKQHGCLLILVAHPRKMNRNVVTNQRPVPEMYDINGSAEFLNKADYGFIVERDRTANVTRVYVEKVKFKHLGQGGCQTFVYDLLSGRYYPCEEIKDAAAPGGCIVKNTQFDTGSWLTENPQ